jgi:hypothetical protein
VIAGLAILDSPARQRQKKLDARRVDDLVGLERAINTFWKAHNALPEDLATLAASFYVSTVDPVTGSPYAYEIEGSEAFRLCAVFATDSRDESAPLYRAGPIKWEHGTGRSCFELKVEKKAD